MIKNKKTVHEIIKSLLLIRMVEEEICKRYGTIGTDQEMRCPVHISIGQESVAVGVCANLNKNDTIYSGHRSHAHYLAKGGNLSSMINEIYGKMGGCLDGRGGSMHLMDESAGVKMSLPIVGSSIPLAVGAALANKINKNNQLVVSFFGDGAVEEGVFHESLNFASVNKLPVVFICENNLYSIYTHLKERQPERPLTMLGKAHKIKSYSFEGIDALVLKEKISGILRFTRENRLPAFVVINTYRFLQHCGVQTDDHLEYRGSKELKAWTTQDPIEVTCSNAILNGLISELEIKSLKEKINIEIQSAFNNAAKKPLPTADMAKKFVYWNQE